MTMLHDGRFWRKALAAAALCLVLAPGGAWAKSVALVIGNKTYAHLGVLDKPIEDAQGYADALRRQGFEVTLLTDLDERGFRQAVASFVERIQPGDTAAFVFSGHGWSDGQVNYLLPVDVGSGDSQSLTEMASIELRNGSNGVLDRLQKAGASVRVAIIDACRNNPFSDGTKSGFTRGLTRDPRSQGNFIVYAASPGQLALDRLNAQDQTRYSVFTRVFLPYLEQNIPLHEAIKKSQERVEVMARQRDGHLQTPDYSDGVSGSLCLSGSCERAAPPAQDPYVAPAPSPAPSPPPYVAPAPAPAPAATAPQPASAPAAASEATPAHLLPTPGSVAARELERARAGSAADMFNLGVSYIDGGSGAPQNDTEAARWFYAGAQAGDARAMGNLGWMYERGRGVAQSDTEAVRWYRASAEKGNAMAMGNLGWMYQNGRGVAQSDTEAFRWYRASAEKGNAGAMGNLGWMYQNGRGVAQSDSEAVRWYRAGAEKGDAGAMNSLGFMYHSGRGVPRDQDQARHWYQQAIAAAGSDERIRAAAQSNLDSLDGR